MTAVAEQIATDLRRVLVGVAGTSITTRASGGNQQLTRALGGGNQDSRLAVEIRGDDLDESRRLSLGVLEVLKETPGIANPQIGREEGRPELTIRVDRPKAALLGLSVSNVASTIRTNIGGTRAARAVRCCDSPAAHACAAGTHRSRGRAVARRSCS